MRTPVTRAEVVAYARNVNLRASDAPEMTAQSAEREVDSAVQEAELRRCIGIPTRGREVVRIVSPTLRHQMFEVMSSIAVDLTGPANSARVAAEDARDLAATASKRGVACQERYLQRANTHPGVTRAEVASMPSPLSGTHGSVGLRFRTTVVGTHAATVRAGIATTRKPIQVALYTDAFFLYVGRAGIALEAFGITKPFPPATERRLISLLYSRARAHKL